MLSSRVAYSRLDEMLKEAPPRGESMSLPAPKGDLLLENVFASAPGAPVAILKGLNFAVNAGEVGRHYWPVGFGQVDVGTTIGRRVAGQGRPRAPGRRRCVPCGIKTNWARILGYLPQDIELFEGTIAENIARFGEADDGKVILAAQRAGVHDMILRLPQGYDTRLGVGGASLSGGQKQRVGLARAIYGDPALVVLDEPNSNLDDVGEAALVHTVNDLKKRGATVIVITHRMNILERRRQVAGNARGRHDLVRSARRSA